MSRRIFPAQVLAALTVFAGAFLLFQVQPVIGKYILPWFGGTPSVWTSCMLFFQVLLLAGYVYAHGICRWLAPRAQSAVHTVLLLAAVLTLPITPSNGGAVGGEGSPVWRILMLLSASIGLPYFVLSATGPLVQAWYSRLLPYRLPYRLYALSNLGSLLALLSYPFWFEVKFSRRAQTEWWSWGMGVFAVLCGALALLVWRHGGRAAGEPSTEESAPRPEWGRYLWWAALPACAVVVLLATTNKVCQDIAVVPLFWVVPLGLYLLTFIICFDSPRWYSRVVFGTALGPAVAAVLWVLRRGADATLWQQVVCYCAALFVCGMVCHGELYRLRPHPARLTVYYLLIALGGALGGLAVAVVAPMVFRTYVELHWGLGICLALFALVCLRDRGGLGDRGWAVFAWLLGLLAIVGAEYLLWRSAWAHARRLHWLVWLAVPVGAALGWKTGLVRARLWACGLLGVMAAGLALALAREAGAETRGAVIVLRNFYGVLSVWDYEKNDPQRHYRVLQHGQITHGLQYTDPQLGRLPSSYYTRNSGVGIAMRYLPTPTNRVVGVVGLGVGTMAAYGRRGDRFYFYEINPAVERVARQYFTYLNDSAADVEVILGDARLALEREASRGFDLLVLDAFSGDAIPVHLLTREAFEVYLRHLKSSGLLAVHISNRHINLSPVLAQVAAHFQLHSITVNGPISAGEAYENGDDMEWSAYESVWVLMGRDGTFFAQPAVNAAASETERGRSVPMWTDDYTSLFPLLQSR